MKTVVFLSMVILCSVVSALGAYNKAHALKVAEKNQSVKSAGDVFSE